MRNSKFMRWDVILLGLVVLRTFWGQFWGQICETDSHTHRSYKYAALVSLRNTNINITRFSHRKSPTNQYISFTLRQEVVRKCHATAAPHTAPAAARNAPVWAHSQSVGIDARPAIYRPKFPAFGAFFPKKGFSSAGFAQTVFACTGKACTNKY